MLFGDFQSVWPSYPHLLRYISDWILTYLHLVHRSKFDIFSGQKMRVIRKHLFIKIWIMFTNV